jgi:hypothetical protein
MPRASARSWSLVIVGTILCAGFLAGCDGSSDPAADTASSATGSDSSNITPVQDSAVTLTWQPPTENTNGTALTDLTGYTISYGTQPNEYTNTITLTNPGLTTYVVDNLSPGTYYFTIAAVASDGVESEPSAPVSTTVN